MRKLNHIAVTGGSGFIGSNFIHYMYRGGDFNGIIVNVDKLTYAGNPLNLTDIANEHGSKTYFFEKTDICDYEQLKNVFRKYDIDAVVHFAAESHVDRSIFGPRQFIETNILGTFHLLEIAREFWGQRKDTLFHHVSTDEVYGSLGTDGYFTETTPYCPNSPYSASKASSDHLVRAYAHTYGLPVTVSNCSNNYGPYQFPEKLIPLMISNIIDEKPLPVYGDGMNVRDWLYVEDHVSAIWTILNRGKTGETYNIGGENEWENIKLINVLCEKMAERMNNPKDYYKRLITFVKDRPGHDRRYAINCERIKHDLGWNQSVDFETGLEKTIEWYLQNKEWSENVKSGEYRKWIDMNYENRGQAEPA
jgi:dTDP-glucose 4,6-dehydratase